MTSVTNVASVLDAFHLASRCHASVWSQAANGTLTWEAATNRAPPPSVLPSPADGLVPIDRADGHALIAAVPGPRRVWLVVGPAPSDVDLEQQIRFLLPVVTQFLQSALEVEHAANELAERYEEINLLYTISEILGRTVALEEATSRILNEISETVGARKAVVLVHDAVTHTLHAVASLEV